MFHPSRHSHDVYASRVPRFQMCFNGHGTGQECNDELHTVNSELLSKVEALDRANSDLQNIFESTQIATVFLDKGLVTRIFTPAVSRIFNILPGDLGRPLTDITLPIWRPT